MAIDPNKYTQLLWCLECQNKNLFDTFALINTWFLFFSFFFSKLELDHHHLMSIFISIDLSLLHHLTLDHPLLSTHLAQGLVHRFYQLSKTKLGLSQRGVPWIMGVALIHGARGTGAGLRQCGWSSAFHR